MNHGRTGYKSSKSEMAFTSSPLAVSVSELKVHLRLEHDNDDTYLNGLILASQQYVSNAISAPLLNSTCKSYYNVVSDILSVDTVWWTGVRQGSLQQTNVQRLELDFPRVFSLTSVKSYNVSDVETVIDTDFFRLDQSSVKPSVVKTAIGNWGNDLRPESSIIVEYVSGFGSTANDVPHVLRQAMMILCTHWYENRQYYNVGMPFSGQIATVNQSIAHSVTSMIQQYRSMML